MRRRIFGGAALAAALGMLAFGGTASAGHPGGCPANYEPVPASVDPIANKNGDDWICTKSISLGNDKGAFSDIDNNAQGSNLP